MKTRRKPRWAETHHEEVSWMKSPNPAFGAMVIGMALMAVLYIFLYDGRSAKEKSYRSDILRESLIQEAMAMPDDTVVTHTHQLIVK